MSDCKNMSPIVSFKEVTDWSDNDDGTYLVGAEGNTVFTVCRIDMIMTLDQIKTWFPETYEEIVLEGLKADLEQTKAERNS
jgi:hypothetical protein